MVKPDNRSFKPVITVKKKRVRQREMKWGTKGATHEQNGELGMFVSQA